MSVLRLVPTPPDLRRWAAALVSADQASPGGDLAHLLPAGLTPARGWPGADDVLGLSYPRGLLIVVDDVAVGSCGPKEEATDGRVEIGYGLATGWQGRGIGTAAVGLLLELLADRGVRTVTAEVADTNTASSRLLASLGFDHLPRAAAAGHTWWQRGEAQKTTKRPSLRS